LLKAGWFKDSTLNGDIAIIFGAFTRSGVSDCLIGASAQPAVQIHRAHHQSGLLPKVHREVGQRLNNSEKNSYNLLSLLDFPLQNTSETM